MHYLIEDLRVRGIMHNFSPDAPFTWSCGSIVKLQGVADATWRARPLMQFASANGTLWTLRVELSVQRVKGDEESVSIAGEILKIEEALPDCRVAIVEWANACQGGIVQLDGSHYLPGDLDRIVASVHEEGGRPVINLGDQGKFEIWFTPDGKMKSRRFKPA